MDTSDAAPISPVLVVGSGPTGLVTALILRQNGVHVRIIEKRREYPVGQRGAGIQPRTLELHHLLGTVNDVLALASPPQLMRFYAPSPDGYKEVKKMNPFVSKPSTPDTPYPNGLMLGQSAHEAILRKHLAQLECHVELATELRSFKQFEDHVVANIVKYDENGQETLEISKFRWLVGADGAHSIVRKGLGLSFLGETIAVDLVLGDVYITNTTLTPDWHNWRQDDPAKPMVATLRPATEKGVWNFLLGGYPIDKLRHNLTHENLVKSLHQATGRTDIDFGEIIWIGNWKPNIRMVDKFGVGRVFVAGDAAHVHSPTGAQGMNSGFQDGFNLAWKLALIERGLAPEALVASYNAERLPVIAEMLDMTTVLFNHVRSGDQDKAWERSAKHTMLGVNYRTSDLVFDERHGETSDERISSYSAPTDFVVRAGDRAPDASGLLRQDSQETRLFDIFRPFRHSALIFSSTQAALTIAKAIQRYPTEAILPVVILPGDLSATDDQAVVDRDGHAAQAYKIEREGSSDPVIVVVRPDGYIGTVATSVEGVEKYLARILRPTA